MLKQSLLFSFILLYYITIIAMEETLPLLPLLDTTLHKINDLPTITSTITQRTFGFGDDAVKSIENKPVYTNGWNCLSIEPYAHKIYSSIITPFIVKKDKFSFYVQHDKAHITELPMQSDNKEATLKTGYTHFLHCCIKSNEHDYLFAGGSNGIVHMWKSYTNKISNKKETVRTDFSAHRSTVVCLATEGDYLCSAGSDGTVNLWHISKDSINKTSYDLTNLTERPRALYFSGRCAHSLMMRNNIVYIGSGDGDISSIDVRSSDITNTRSAHDNRISCIIGCKKDDNLFYTGSFDGTIKLFDIRNLKQATKEIQNQDHGITCIYESNDGKKLFSGGADGVRIWDIADSENAPLNVQKIRSMCHRVKENLESKNLQFIDSIAANDDETELYIANVPCGVTVLASKYSFDELSTNLLAITK
jgi:WD40 repeat protein